MEITVQSFVRNTYKAIAFEHPDFIPMNFGINPACWHHYDHEAMFDLMESHPLLFRNYQRPKQPYVQPISPICMKDHPYTDTFGCVWKTADDGILGTVVEHPLEDWDNFENWHAPDPDHNDLIEPIDWEERKKNMRAELASIGHVQAGLNHGHTFLKACDLRGYTNVMYDMFDEEPMLDQLLEILTEFNLNNVYHYLDCGVDIMCYPEDLGMQVGPMLSPELFRKYIKPCYQRLVKPAKDAGCLIHMHSDGDIRLLVDDIVDVGMDCINLQDLVNGVDWIADHFRGKTCVDLDIDRQLITTRGTPEQIDQLIREEVEKIGTPQGGLCMIYGLYPGVPLENVKALMDAMERYMFYYD